MAENAAHLTSAILEPRPSIFEVLAQESLISSIRPALKHAVKVVAESRPEKFAWMLQWYDEIFTLLDFILQNYYLHNYNGSFAENFYGLKRVPFGSGTGGSSGSLPKKIHWKSLICLVLFPYAKHKVDQWFEDIRHNLNVGRIPKNKVLLRLYKAFVGIYPYVHMAWEGSVLGYQLAYMLGKSLWHSPLVRLSGVELRHLEEEDSEGNISASTNWNEASLGGKLRIASSKVFNVTAVTLSTGLSVGVFFLQFLEWWYASDNNAPSLLALPVPDPPQPEKDVSIPPYNVCPLCLKIRTNDTVLSISGYVFCYPCVHEYIGQHRCCPVTSYPAKVEHLVKLYPPDS